MKFLISQLSYFVTERQARRNLRALVKYLVFLLAVISVYSIGFHFIMIYAEGQTHSWLTGFYWTLTVMSTLGFGDITFHSDLGRLFSILVLLSGVILLLIVLPFAFIRFFYAPWLEARIRLRAPREIPEEVSGHVLICRYDPICPDLIRKLEFNRIPYYVLEPDPVAAARLASDGVSTVTGEIDSEATFERLGVRRARMVFANAEDTTNTNIALTVRSVDAGVPIVAVAEDEDSVDILELSGATHVLPLKKKLGEHLAARISVGSGVAHVVGNFRDLLIAEFVAHDTTLDGKTLEETRLRETTGVAVVGVWERGKLEPAYPGRRLTNVSVPVVIGTAEQIGGLDTLLRRPDADGPVLVIGGGKVGRVAAVALRSRGAQVRVVEKRKLRGAVFEKQGIPLIHGDANDREVLREAGLEDASAVLLSTSDDAVNIYLAVYCRRLKPELNIVSRITHERNTEAIYRAGADSVLSYGSLGREYFVALLLGRDPVMVGEGADFFVVSVTESLAGKTLGEGGIGARSGLIVIAIEFDGQVQTNPSASARLPANGRLVMLGTPGQRAAFAEEFE